MTKKETYQKNLDRVKTVGGAIVIAILIMAVRLIWGERIFWIKMIGSAVVALVLVRLLELSYKSLIKKSDE